MKIIGLFLLMTLTFAIKADPAPFGMVINQTTVSELKNKYPVTPLGMNKNNGLEAFDIDPQYMNFEGLLSAKAAFSADGILKLVQMSLPKEKFNEIFKSLSRKYTLVYKNTPANGIQEAKFIEGNTYIMLYAMENSQEMDFLYINKKMLEEALLVKPKPILAQNQHKEVSQL